MTVNVIAVESFGRRVRRRQFLRTGAAGFLSVGTVASTSTASGHPVPGESSDETGEADETDGDAERDATDEYSPLGSIDVAGAREAVVGEGGEVVYVAAMDGFATVDISDPTAPTVLAERRDIGTDSGRLRGIWDLHPDGDRLAVVGPAGDSEGLSGFALFDVRDPTSPEQVAFHETEFHIHNAFFADGIVYLTGSGLAERPLVLVDASDDDPAEAGRWSPIDENSDWADVPAPLRSIHDAFVHDGIAYLSYWEAGTWLVDVRDPTAPAVRARVGGASPADLRGLSDEELGIRALTPPGNHHYATVSDDGELLAVGVESWATDDEEGVRGEAGELVGGPGGVTLYDTSDQTSPERLAHIEPPESADQTTSGEFTTAHNCDIAGDRLYTSWYFGGVAVHDISDPANPTERARWRDPDETAFWTAQAAGDAFVASSAELTDFDPALAGTREALYVFPDEIGTQANPGSPGAPDSEDTNEDTSGADGFGPGLGVAGALAGLGGASLLARRAAGDLSPSDGE